MPASQTSTQMPRQPAPVAQPARKLNAAQPRPFEPMSMESQTAVGMRGGKGDGGAICCGICAGLCCFECLDCCC